jgi:hypothetical protein
MSDRGLAESAPDKAPHRPNALPPRGGAWESLT